MAGWFGEACGSCIRNDKAVSCTFSDAYKAQQQLLKEGLVGNKQEIEDTTIKEVVQVKSQLTTIAVQTNKK